MSLVRWPALVESEIADVGGYIHPQPAGETKNECRGCRQYSSNEQVLRFMYARVLSILLSGSVC